MYIMSIMDYQLVNEIINNLWFFQTESIVPIFQEISLMILILFVVSMPLTVIIDQVLHKSKQKIALGFILYPILIIALYGFLYFFGGYFGFDFPSIDISKIIDNAINYWWVFFIYWPIFAIVAGPVRLIGRNQQGGVSPAVQIIFAPIWEDFVYRFMAINTIYLLTNSIEISLIFSAIAFSLIHLPNKAGDGWGGPVAINGTLIMGVAWGIIAIKYGLIFSIAVHMLQNTIATLILPKLLEDS
jgi:membrane protease YdiL (CAAX protease family)